MATKAIDKVFNEAECAAIANGFKGIFDWWRQFKETMPHGDTWNCALCDAWALDPDRNEQGEPICPDCKSPMEQTPF